MTDKDQIIPRNQAVEDQIFAALDRMGWKYTATSIDNETRTNIIQTQRRDWEADYAIGERITAAQPGETLVFKCLECDQLPRLQSAITARAFSVIGPGNYKTAQDVEAGCVRVQILIPGLSALLSECPQPEGE